MLTVKNFIMGSLAAIAIVAGVFAFAGLNLGGGGEVTSRKRIPSAL